MSEQLLAPQVSALQELERVVGLAETVVTSPVEIVSQLKEVSGELSENLRATKLSQETDKLSSAAVEYMAGGNHTGFLSVWSSCAEYDAKLDRTLVEVMEFGMESMLGFLDALAREQRSIDAETWLSTARIVDEVNQAWLL